MAKLKLLIDKIESLCQEYDIDIELDKARLQSYKNNVRRVICIGKGDGPLMARKQFSAAYPDPPRINPRRGFRRVLLDRLNRLLQTETEEHAEKRLFRSQLTEWLKLPRSILSGKDRADMEVDKDEYTLEISNLVREKQKVESAANAAKKAEAAAKKKLTEAASSVKTTDKVLRAQIETILKDYGIDRGAWHGGDLVGNHCRLLMAEAKDIFTCIEKVLTERIAAIGMSEEAINSIKLRCEVKRDLLQQYDGFFARLSLPQKDVTPTTIEEAQRFIKNANIL
jgi:hypothetical protein